MFAGKASRIFSSVPESHVPREFLGYGRDSAKLLTVNRGKGSISSGTFHDFADQLEPGDAIIVNNSSLVNASFSAYFPDSGEFGFINFGTSRRGKLSLVEPRPKDLNYHLRPGTSVELTGTSRRIRLMARDSEFPRYWWAETRLSEEETRNLMAQFGRPIAYDHVSFPIPLEYYTTVFSRVPGSVEPPSAGIPFTEEIMGKLRERKIGIGEITLHCNLGSLEPEEFSDKDHLLREQYEVPRETIELIEGTRNRGGKVIAIGTTVVRALESAYRRNGPNLESSSRNTSGEHHSSISGNTDLFIKPGFRFRSVDGLLTGMHDPTSSHLDMISAFLSSQILGTAYRIAIEEGYLWHEFGDLTLIL